MAISHKIYDVVDGISLSFTDSGAPTNSSNYTTLVAIHGFGFPGVCFEGAQNQAADYNLRVVAVNRRDYPGSTPYSDEELAALHGKNESQARELFDKGALHLSLFLKKLIEEEHIPEISADRKSGGIALMGWSLGVFTAIMPFATREVMEEDTYQLLQRYLKDFILYDPPFNALGLSLPEGLNVQKLYSPMADPTAKTPQDVFDKFVLWAASNFNYTIKNDMATYESIETGGSVPRSDSCVVDTLSRDELGRLTDSGAALRADIPVLEWQQIAASNAQQVLFPSDPTTVAFPNLSITYLYAPRSIWLTVICFTEIKKQYEKRREENRGEPVRPIKFFELEGADHFIHYTDPKYFLKVVKGTVHAA